MAMLRVTVLPSVGMPNWALPRDDPPVPDDVLDARVGLHQLSGFTGKLTTVHTLDRVMGDVKGVYRAIAVRIVVRGA